MLNLDNKIMVAISTRRAYVVSIVSSTNLFVVTTLKFPVKAYQFQTQWAKKFPSLVILLDYKCENLSGHWV